MKDSAKHVWVPDARELFTAASIVSDENEDTVTVRILKSGETKEINAKDIEKMNPSQFDRVGDMAELTYLNEPSVVHNLSSRWLAHQIYTYSGLFLVAVNPYEKLGIYDEATAQNYKGKRRSDVDPHIFAVAEESYSNMLTSGKDQSILITGESGAGKTENTKKAIQYLSSVTHHKSPSTMGAIDERILQTNPILEAFGNAQTIRNANSSRFGKFIKINFMKEGKDRATIAGASIEWYLLEKSRVVTQHASERNYHVFYQLLAGAPSALKKRLHIPENADPKKFSYLASGAAHIDGVDDSQLYIKLVDAFRIMGFAPAQVDEIMGVVAAILFLGQIEFRPATADQGTVVDTLAVDKVAELLGVKSDEFTKSILQPRVKIGREFTTQSRTANQAQHTVNAISKALYERLFSYIVEQLNQRLGSSQAGPCIGVLDIAGFEIFEENSFEQLCINYTNEKLQQFFNHHMFVLEQQEYVKEKVDWDYVDYGVDLQPTIDLIEKSKSPMGIFSCLNEESLLPSGTEKQFAEKLEKQWGNSNPKFKPSRLTDGFTISHYAQSVDYSTEGWLEKNKDPLSDSVEQVLSQSQNMLINSLFTSDGTKVKAKAMFRTVAQRYKEQLNDLMLHLEATHPHFVRCILPNTIRSSSVFDNRLVLDQLRYNGVLEGIRIARSGFPNRLEFSEFCSRYRPLSGKSLNNRDSQQACADILSGIGLDSSLYKVGLSKVFFRNGVLADLEHKLERLIQQQTTLLQAFSRGALVRKSVRAALHRRQASKVLATAFRMNNKHALDPWWQVTAGLKPLLLSKENMDNSRKDMRMQKLEKSLHRLKEEQVDLMSSRNELRGELITALKDKEHIETSLRELKARSKEENEAHELAVTSAKSRDDASRAALLELGQAHSKLRDEFEVLQSKFGDSDNTWQRKLEEAVKTANDEAKLKFTALESKHTSLQSEHDMSRQRHSDEITSLNKSLNNQEQDHTAALAKAESQRDSLRKELETAIAANNALKEKCESAEKHAKSLELNKADYEKTLSEIRSGKEGSDIERDALKQTCRDLQSALDSTKMALESEKQKHESVVVALQSSLDRVSASHRELKDDQAKSSQDYESAVSKKDAELQKSSAELNKVQGWLAKAKVELRAFADTKRKYMELENEHKSSLEALESLKSNSVGSEKVDKLTEERDNLRRDLEKHRQEFEKQRKDLDIATDNLLKSDEELNSRQKEYKEAHAKITTLSSRNNEMSAELGQLRKSNKTMTGVNADIQKRLSEMEPELKKKEAELAESQKEIHELKSSLATAKEKTTDLTNLVNSRTSSGSSMPVGANFDISRKLAATRMELAETQKQLLKLKTQSVPSATGAATGYQKRFGKGDAEQELAMVQHDLAAADAKIEEYEAELATARNTNAQYLILRQKYEKLQREKAALAQDRSQLLLGRQNERGHTRELDIAKAQAADVKRLQSEINVLKLQLVRNERELKEKSVKLADATNERDVDSLKHRLRLAEIAKLQLAKTVHELTNPSADSHNNHNRRSSTQIRPDGPLRSPTETGEPMDPNDPPLVVHKRGVPQALRNISNDRRVSEQAHRAAEHVKNKDLEEAVEIYKGRAQEFHTKLEKAETVVQAALRAETSAREQIDTYKTRLARIEDDHAMEIAQMRSQIVETQKQLDERDSTIERLKLKSSAGSGLQGQVRSVNGTLKDVAAERDRLMTDKSKLERRMQDLISSMNQQPRKLHEQLLFLRQNEQQMMMEQSDLRWKIERKERYLDTMRRNLNDVEGKYEKSLAEIERLQASEASREIVLRRASREVAEAKDRYLMAERELEQYRLSRKSTTKTRDDAPVFI